MGCKQEDEGMIKGGTQEERKDKERKKDAKKKRGDPRKEEERWDASKNMKE
jgi:hypothetical protein